MSYTVYLATRYLFGKHRIPFIAFISKTTMIGMALGISALLLALGVMRGFESVVTEKIIGFDTHIRIEKLFESGFDLDSSKIDQIRNIEGIDLFFPIHKAQVMLKANGITEGAMLEALPPEALDRLYSVSDNMLQTSDSSGGLLLGAAMAEQLEVTVGQSVMLYQVNGVDNEYGFPVVATSVVSNIYSSGMVDYDKAYLYTDLETLSELFPSQPLGDDFGIFLSDLSLTHEVMEAVDALLPYSHLSISWRDRHQTLFNWMKTQQLPIFIIFSLIMVVALVNISSTLMLIIMEKRSEIGTLRAMGTSKQNIRRIFALEGFLMGATGTLSGLLITFILTFIQSRFGLISLPSDVYFMDKVTILMRPTDILLVCGSTILLAMISSLIPAMQASALKPADALRDE